MKKWVTLLLLGAMLFGFGCRSSSLPCPSYSDKSKKENAFQLGGSEVKYDKHGRIKK